MKEALLEIFRTILVLYTSDPELKAHGSFKVPMRIGIVGSRRVPKHE
jgi:hypothetical protein